MSNLFQAVLTAASGGPFRGPDGWYGQIFVFEAEFLGFAGHFPDNPVLPAIVQIMASCAASAAWLGRPPEVRGVRNAKFLIPVLPGDAVTVLTRPLGEGSAEVKLISDDRTVSTFTLFFSGSREDI